MSVSGALVVDKPQGWTSHDVVSKVRRILGERSVGHLGTLDPLATGVLPLLIGSATRLAKFYSSAEKVYDARIRFGFATDSYDAEGEPTTPEVPVHLDRQELERALARFHGTIEQTPPRFSAKKIHGVRAYRLARENKPVVLSPVEVEIFRLDLLEVTTNEATIRVHCGSGTYVRTLAHDLGVILGCGAHLAELRRTRSGDFTIDQAHTISQLESLRSEQQIDQAVLPAAILLPEFPAVHTDDATAAQIRYGRDFHTSPFLVRGTSRFVKAIASNGGLLAIGEAVLPNVYHPVVVFP